MTDDKHRRTHKVPKVRVDLLLDLYQLEALDEAAKKDCTNRSQLIRTAINWYLWPSARALESADNYIFESIKHRRDSAAARKKLKELGDEIDAYDT